MFILNKGTFDISLCRHLGLCKPIRNVDHFKAQLYHLGSVVPDMELTRSVMIENPSRY